ncbi:MAG TPA: DUF3703 domain-containing protein [Aggregicoccus sp.]|nr:DUF3703 domain-containing protein [Aggregicoccus sp.]
MTMSPVLRTAFERELAQARDQERAGALREAWRHLERAHVLSQAFALPHVRVHGRMLGYGLRRLDAREVLGQLARVLVAAPGSWLGRAPLGNTGGADVGILTPLPIPADLQALLDAGGP